MRRVGQVLRVGHIRRVRGVFARRSIEPLSVLPSVERRIGRHVFRGRVARTGA